MYKALEISKWFLAKNKAESKMHSIDEEYEGISPLKMQKLLYFAQGVHLALHDIPLFDDAIFAWQHGPVVNDVYQSYKNFGSSFIDIDFSESDEKIIDIIENDAKAHESLELTYDNFAIYTAWQLRNMTHVAGGPWDIAYTTHGPNAVIDTNDIKEYFVENVFEN